jgi:choline dehydrogenase-like flavoprotein
MGTGAGHSVVNSYGQTHEIANLYVVAGPGIFATGGASNPTYMIFAISLRGAEQLRRNGKRSPPERDGAVDVPGPPSSASAG